MHLKYPLYYLLEDCFECIHMYLCMHIIIYTCIHTNVYNKWQEHLQTTSLQRRELPLLPGLMCSLTELYLLLLFSGLSQFPRRVSTISAQQSRLGDLSMGSTLMTSGAQKVLARNPFQGHWLGIQL